MIHCTSDVRYMICHFILNFIMFAYKHPRLVRRAAAFGSILWIVSFAAAQGNLLRNGAFQDDWLTKLPEVKNHHYCFSSEHYNRRDFNPDGWECRGSWEWRDAGKAPGMRRFVMRGPDAAAVQRVNWALIHNQQQAANFADAGRFPQIVSVNSANPAAFVRDLTLRIHLRGSNVAENAGVAVLALHPPGNAALASPFGTVTPPTVSAETVFPAGSYDWRWITLTLPAAQWLEAVNNSESNGQALPGTASVSLRYQGEGEVKIAQVELTESGPESPNLFEYGSFETVDDSGYPLGWSRTRKYTWFPPGNYYIFNTWHNTTFDDRGPVGSDKLIARRGDRSLKMIVAAGDEKFVISDPIKLNQRDARLIEVHAWIKTDRLTQLQLDAVDESGERLDGHITIHKAQLSIGSDDWRQIRQVFRPRRPVQSLRIKLCARGVNGYTLTDVAHQPQNTVTGTIWWDDIRVYEPETDARELREREISVTIDEPLQTARRAEPLIENLDLGERLIGENVLRASLFNPGPPAAFALRWEFASPSGVKSSYTTPALRVETGGRTRFELPYYLTESCDAYTEYQGKLTLIRDDQPAAATELWFATWSAPLHIKLGNLYLLPEQRQFVRMNFGLSHATMAGANAVRLDIIRRGTGEIVHTKTIPATPETFASQLDKIPDGLRDDLTNLLLTDLDVSVLPLQPFNRPERNWILRATLLDETGQVLTTADTPPFCRLAHQPPQAPVQTVSIDTNNLLYVNGEPWMPWGAVYGHQPVYDGPADPGPADYHDLRNLKGWSIYDRFGASTYTRSRNDFNCMRYVAGSITPRERVTQLWETDNLLCSSAFVVPHPVWSIADLQEKAGGGEKLADYLEFVKTAPMIVSTAPGIEEAFGLFHGPTQEQLNGMEEVVRHLRDQTGKPVMVGHGGYWNRFEFEKASFYDIFDPETEPFFPANLHTDLKPLIERQPKTIWLRPQMYESVPYERWRFTTYVELMRGARGWQIAHGPGDQSLFRGLHAEMEFFKPIAYSTDPGPRVSVTPWLEHWSRRHADNTYLIVATTRGLAVGAWDWTDSHHGQAGRARVTGRNSEFRTAGNNYGVDAAVVQGPAAIGIENLPDARRWSPDANITQWLRIDPDLVPEAVVMLVKADGRWTHAGRWGQFDMTRLRSDSVMTRWFLKMFYRNSQGFAFDGWYGQPKPEAMGYLPEDATDHGPLPAAGEWVNLQVPLASIDAAGKLVDGIAFMHEGGTVYWGRTAIVSPDGTETLVWGDHMGTAPDDLTTVRIEVEGLEANTPVKVLFEDRVIIAQDGFFTDDFRGDNLFQRFGGGLRGGGYGDEPVALKLYEIP